MNAQLVNRRLDPIEAEVAAAGAEIAAGRLVGPRCRYASTVEVAYPFRPAPGGGLRAVVHEPSIWDPETPFLYEATVETADGRRSTFRHGLRQLSLTAAGLRVNRRPFRVAAVFRSQLADAAELRAAGVNAVVCPATPATEALWDDADEIGFFVLGLVAGDSESLALAERLGRHASALGWMFESIESIDPTRLRSRPGQDPLIGILAAVPIAPPTWAQFIAGPPTVRGHSMPWLCLGEPTADAAAEMFGTIHRPASEPTA